MAMRRPFHEEASINRRSVVAGMEGAVTRREESRRVTQTLSMELQAQITELEGQDVLSEGENDQLASHKRQLAFIQRTMLAIPTPEELQRSSVLDLVASLERQIIVLESDSASANEAEIRALRAQSQALRGAVSKDADLSTTSVLATKPDEDDTPTNGAVTQPGVSSVSFLYCAVR